MDFPSECLVMAKPGGARCNMRCAYCYYIDKARSQASGGEPCMSEKLLEEFIIQRFEASGARNTHFEWHGGEPTILGLEYFRTIARIQRKHAPQGKTFSNGIQTNGLLIDEAWADFLAEERFSTGLSIDGPEECHDCFRTSADGSPTHARVVRSFRLLQARGVFTNVLCVLHSANTPRPHDVYDFFSRLGVHYLQFLPLVGADKPCAHPQEIGNFLCHVFDRWIRRDVGEMVIQIFDEALRPFYGIDHALCIYRPTCGEAVVIEHDGSVYCCDHFVDREHLIGTIKDKRLRELANDPALVCFGNAKQEELLPLCKKCEAMKFCNGGCPKDRILAATDTRSDNYLCTAYKTFFLHAKQRLEQLAAHIKEGKSLRSFKPA